MYLGSSIHYYFILIMLHNSLIQLFKQINKHFKSFQLNSKFSNENMEKA